MVREGGEVTCEETEKVQWTGEAGEGYHQPGWLDFFHLPFWSKPGCLSIFIYNFDQNPACLSIFTYNFDQNQVVCVF